ncbi:MAG TPA: SCP2 sterol-binding domain-containing protein [Streptosporangiaceae bacterium]|nr:SCP2 sterol-binding domain-containing protein [Streptosporangiaceae bacterium]
MRFSIPVRPWRASLRDLAGQIAQARCSARDKLRGRGQAGLRRVIGGVSDTRLEQIFGTSQAQRAAFAMMTRHFDPSRAAGFEGAIVYDLGLADGTRRPWSIEVHDGQARVRPGEAAAAALTIRVPLAAFIRVLTSGDSLHPLILDGRLTMHGDTGLASRVAEMFGTRPAR